MANRAAKSPARRANTQPTTKPVGFASEGVENYDVSTLKSNDWLICGALSVVALFVRLFRLSQPTSVVFDEVHFGGFASKYIKGKFFMDVHPPLAKLLITLAGWLAGFDGEFDFKDIGKDYIEPAVPYISMRLLPALMGVATIPIMFMTLKASGCKTSTAAMGAGLVLFENGLVTQSRLILLDSPLVIFTALTVLGWTSFTNQHEQGPSKAFTPVWWFWLAFSGLCLGATVSVKWVGLFTIAWIGSLTLLQLWLLLGDTKTVTPRLWFKHFFARFFCLVVIPVSFYMSMFAIHFLCLVNPGDGDGFMSSEFQSTLNSKGMQDVPADVAFGSRVSIRHHNTQGGYLHSHTHMYPTGSKQQQITLYPHKDENNVWLLENQTQPVDLEGTEIKTPFAWDNIEPTLIEDGAVLKLYHVITDRRVHSHDHRPPVTDADWQNEVSAYGYEGFEGDANDLFKVEIVKHLSDGEVAKNRVRTIETKFKLVHIMTGCVLFSHKVKLPDWGFEQQEVTCAKGGTLPNSIWYIESNEHPQLKEDAEKVNYRNPGFFGKFWELQKVMWTTNAGLVESHAWDSRPLSWPILRRGINFWGKDHRQIYLIGNPLIWWTSTVSVVVYLAFKALAVLRWQRGYKDYNNVPFKRFDYEVGTSVLGWALHWLPFFLMQRQLFLHHYFPALYFAIIALSQTYDFITARVPTFGLRQRPVIGTAGAAIFLALAISIFYMYSPVAYGNAWTKTDCAKAKLFETWDWDCNTFYDSYSEYQTYDRSIAAAKPTEVAASPAVQFSHDEVPEAQVTNRVLAGEEKIEYRDEAGNILNEEQVKELEGKVSFSTRYETRTRLVDANGNEVYDGRVEEEDESYAGTIAEGSNQETGGVGQEAALEQPASVNVNDDVEKEKSIEASTASAEPESDAGTATGRDEL
ncbi:dolichyl-phosphate-mannose-protein mannosyltransferase 1 [Aureobasidium namibiae CBS 147.97]|uniref:Dolichyl-phosphate-mannose--protein mannosyltransferase n=1 Tax=Aureobasidium namibiae CBS 147.97 TaxID=1043004 RepID=A0A074WLN2_9PEZI|nr:dolichyl-phosphate-mannose-protein mannosyltransferase 1 [Aureobasidium namibiae CBS 147.97]KEQ72514.1 dolichyl-phosphate-mannose-protein mannosyltransferase 1 [Aureobasidium namibiae CBS 147.97]